eukprot:5357610-Amphidinium_carterae.1
MPVSVNAVEDFVVAQNSSVAWKPFAISACTAVPAGSLCASGTAFYIATDGSYTSGCCRPSASNQELGLTLAHYVNLSIPVSLENLTSLCPDFAGKAEVIAPKPIGVFADIPVDCAQSIAVVMVENFVRRLAVIPCQVMDLRCLAQALIWRPDGSSEHNGSSWLCLRSVAKGQLLILMRA